MIIVDGHRYMNEAVQDGPAHLVFNLDEVGISDWDDRKPKKVAVPITAT
jgi:ABC-type nitrate/sulfonate/bicarbonate transport system substrate-binding protein